MDSCQAVLQHEVTGVDVAKSTFMIFVAAFSMVASCFVIYMMIINKHLQAHPQRIVLFMCLCEAIAANGSLFAFIGNRWIICKFRLDELFAYSTFTTREEAFAVLRQSNNITTNFFQFTSLALNFFFCWDLIKSLRAPFMPHDRRMKYYIAASFSIGLLLCLTDVQ
jgi:hypothetical protein